MTTAREELIARKTLQIMRTFPTDPIIYGSTPRIPGAMREAAAWVTEQIILVRFAAEPNPWKEQSDENICAEILRIVKLKEAQAIKDRLTNHVLLQKGRAKPRIAIRAAATHPFILNWRTSPRSDWSHPTMPT